MLEINKIFCGDCLEVMKDIDDKSIDMILCDLPYNITSRNKWDKSIPNDILFNYYRRCIKDNAAIILTAVQPFTTVLIYNNIDIFKYEWIWEKSRAVNFLNAKKQPMRKHESVLVFYKYQCVYNPQNLIYNPKINKRSTTGTNCNESGKSNFSEYTNYPNTILQINSEGNTIHPTQKPVALFEYLIKTYTNEGMLVLDNCIGSGTTAIAALKTGRNFIGIEKEQKYVDIANKRIEDYLNESDEEEYKLGCLK